MLYSLYNNKNNNINDNNNNNNNNNNIFIRIIAKKFVIAIIFN